MHNHADHLRHNLKQPPMMMAKNLLSFLQAFIALLFCCVLFSACAPTEQNAIKPQEGLKNTDNTASVLRVGVTPDAPPLIYKDKGVITGMEAELATKFAASIGKQVKFIDIQWDRQIDALEQGQIDIIMSGMSITQARKYRIAFSTPYLRSGQIMLVRLEEKGAFITGVSSLLNRRYTIGVVSNTTGDLMMTEIMHGDKIKRFTTPETALKALRSDDIDTFIYDAPMICYFAALNESNRLTPILTMASEELLAWGIRKDNPDLLQQANTFVAQLNDSQELRQITRKWIPYL
jgi:ABC-type amino acid transport substrate-binding protein